MFGWVANIFSSSKNTENIVDTACDSVRGVGNWIDNWNFTDQEKATNINKCVDKQLAFVEMQRDENSVRSQARRKIAIQVISTWLFCINSAIVSTWLSLFFEAFQTWEPISTFAVNASKVFADGSELFIKSSGVMSVAVVAVITFYFAPNMVGRAIADYKAKKNA